MYNYQGVFPNGMLFSGGAFGNGGVFPDGMLFSGETVRE